MVTFVFYKHRDRESYTNIGRTLSDIVSMFSEYLYDKGDSIVDGSGHVVVPNYVPGMKTGKVEFDANDIYTIKEEEELDENDWAMLERAYEDGKIIYPEQYDSIKNHIEIEEV